MNWKVVGALLCLGLLCVVAVGGAAGGPVLAEEDSFETELDTEENGTSLPVPFQGPTAAFEFAPSDPVAGDEVEFSAGGSEGNITTYRWDFTDNGTFDEVSSAPEALWQYQSPGDYNVTLEVEDETGATDQTSAVVSVSESNGPTADFDSDTTTPETNETVSFDASNSTGDIVEYRWDLTDNGTFDVVSASATAEWEYQNNGNYNVTLEVEEDTGATDRAFLTVSVVEGPTAAFDFSPSNPEAGEAVTFDASASEGNITTYKWDFDGDEQIDETTSDPVTNFTYDKGGQRAVILQVEDGNGNTNTTGREIDVQFDGLTAAFDWSPPEPSSGKEVMFNASESGDSNGTIQEYRWDFTGNGTIDRVTSNPVTNWTFSSGGSYDVELVVENDTGATDATSNLVEVAENSSFQVTILNINNPLTGDDIDVTTQVENAGFDQDTKTLELAVGTLDTNATNVTLGAGESTIETLSISTEKGDSGEYPLIVSTVDDSDVGTVTVTQNSSEFLIQNLTANEPAEGENLSVTVDINNTGNAAGTQSVELNVAALGVKSKTVSLDSGVSTQVTFDIETSGGDAGEYEVTLSTDDDVANTTVTVTTQAQFLLSSVDATTTVEGDNLTVTAQIENTGGSSATQTVSLDVPGLGTDATTVTLDSGAFTEETFSVATGDGDAGEYTATVTTEDDSASVNVTMLAQTEFLVNITGTTTPVEGGQLDVNVTVENVGGVVGTQTISLDVGGLGTASTDVTLAGGASTTETLSVGTSAGNAGSYTATVSSANDSDSAPATVLAQAEFLVNITGTNTPVEGDPLNVDYNVTNTGSASGTQTITLEVDGSQRDSTSVSLSSGTSQTGTLTWGTSQGDSGSYTATVTSTNDTATQSVTVQSATVNFQVDIASSNAPISPGDTLSIDVNVTNFGTVSGTQTIALENGGQVRASTSVTLASGASTTETLTWDTSGDAVGAVSTVSSDNDSETLITTQDSWGQVNSNDTGSHGPVAISPNGALVAHANGSDVVVYDAQTETAVQVIDVAESGIVSLDWHPDGHRLAFGTSGNTLQIYNQTGDTTLDTLSYGGTVEDVEWSPDGEKVLAAAGTTAYVLDADTRAQLRTESLGRVSAVAWSGDAQRFAIGGDGDVQVFEVGGGRIFDVDADGASAGGTTDVVRGLAFARDGARLVTVQQGFNTVLGPDDSTVTVHLYSVGTGTQLDRETGSGDSSYSDMSFADAVADPTDDRVAVASGLQSFDPTLVYTIGTGGLTQTEVFGGQAGSIDWSHSGQYIVDSAGGDEDSEGDTWRVFASLPVVDGTVTDSNGNPVENAYVEISQGGVRVDNMTTDDNGEYTLVVPDTGTYNMTAIKEGPTEYISEVKIVDVPDGGTTVPWTATIIQVPIAGQVVDSDTGDGLNRSVVEVAETDETWSTTTDGGFVLGVPGPGEYTLVGKAIGYRDGEINVTVPDTSGTPGVVIPLDAIEGVPISGTVTDLDGNPIEGATVEAAGNQVQTTATGSYTLGVSTTGTYSVTASTTVDSAAQTVTVPSNGVDGVDFTLDTADGGGPTPAGNLELRNEQTGHLINDREVVVTFSNAEFSAIRNTTTGILNMGSVNLSAPVVARAEAVGFESRRLLIESLQSDRTLFLLDRSNVSTAVLTEFLLDDRTGRFSGPDSETVLEIRKTMPLPGETDNIPWRILLSDFFGAGDEIGMLMEADERYRIRVRNGAGDVRELGAYTAVRNKTLDLVIGELSWELGSEQQNLSWGVSQVNASGTESIRFQIQDNATNTTNISVKIYESGNESRELVNGTVAGPVGNFSTLMPIPPQFRNVTSWTVEWTAQRNGETIDAKTVVGPRKYPVEVNSDWIPIFSALFILFVGGFFSVRVATIGALIVPLVGLALWAAGWLPVPLSWVLAALAIGIGSEFAVRGGFSDNQ
jgi:PKD repeat protein